MHAFVYFSLWQAAVQRFKDQKLIHKRYVMHLLISCKNYFEALPSLLDLSVPQVGPDAESKPRFTVCGDTHGQFYDVLNIFKINGYPSSNVSVTFVFEFQAVSIFFFRIDYL